MQHSSLLMCFPFSFIAEGREALYVVSSVGLSFPLPQLVPVSACSKYLGFVFGHGLTEVLREKNPAWWMLLGRRQRGRRKEEKERDM